MTTVDPDFALQLDVARAAQIWRRSRWSAFLYILVFIPIGLGTTLAVDHPFLFSGLIVLFGGTGVVRWRRLLTGHPPADPQDARRWMRDYGLLSLLSGLIWGCFAGYIQFAYQGTFLQFVILLVSAGIACFAIGAFAGYRPLTLAYLGCVLLPTLLGVAAGMDAEAAVLFSLMVIFLAAVTYQVFEINDWFERSTMKSLLLEKSRTEAEAAARVKSEFLANMSHELRTPMNGVMGMLELLLQSGLDREQKLLARTSHRSAESLLEILNDILDFSKMSAGKLEFVRLDFQPHSAIEDVFDLLGLRALEKGVDLGFCIDPDIPAWVCGDEGRLRQVLMNLVSNAIKFSHGGRWPNGGSVSVEARLLGAAEGTVHVQWSVSDQGQGIDEGTKAKLFEPFMQADNSTSRRFGGTGLGLAISRQLVEAMGGSIAVISEPGAGATFVFDIQLGRASGPHTVTPSVTGSHVLVIEPAPRSLATIGHLLSRHGAIAHLVSTMEDADPLIEAGAYRCIIAGTSPELPAARIQDRVAAWFTAEPPPLFFIVNRGEALEEHFPPNRKLTRPVRSAQIAELLVAASFLPRADVPAPLQPPSRLRGHLLIAEDNAVNQMLAQRLVAALGLTSEVVSDGAAALKAIAAREFHAVLMDCQMPGVDGYEATRLLRQNPQTASIPVVAMTANAMKGDREICLAAGMDDYVSKPVRLDRLREVLSRYLPAAPAQRAASK